MTLSLRWAERCKRAFASAAAGRALFGIVQGGDDQELRAESARALTDIGFDGYAIGGLAVGETQEVMLEIVGETAPALPADRPRYLMGVGTPADLLEAVARGIDMFDCVLPTRNGRHGLAFTRFGPINIKNAHHADDPRPLDAESRCPAARDFSRAYLHHLFRSRRDARRHAPVAHQSLLLPGPDGGRPRRHQRPAALPTMSPKRGSNGPRNAMFARTAPNRLTKETRRPQQTRGRRVTRRAGLTQTNQRNATHATNASHSHS